MPKLSDTQLIILAHAAKHDDRSVLPLPKKLKPDSDTVVAAIKTLISKKLIIEQPATPGAVKWRDGEDGGPFMLVATEAGLRAIKVEPAVETRTVLGTGRKRSRGGSVKASKSPVTKRDRGRKAGGEAGAPPASATRPGTKQAKLIDLLRRSAGATIAEMIKATGWQAHSIRGVMSGALKKKLGLAIDSETTANRGRVYRITDHG